MRKFLFFCSLLLMFAAGISFAQTGDGSITDTLVNLGVNPALAAVISLVFVTVVLQYIPVKWAAVTKWAKEVAKLLYLILDKADEKLNRISARDREKRQDKKNLAGALKKHQDELVSKGFYKNKILSILALLAMAIPLHAQGPWDGFFEPVGQAVNTSLLMQADAGGGQTAKKGVIKIRTSFAVNALAVEIGKKQPEATSLSGLGLGLSYGSWLTDGENPYCQWSVNAAFLTKMDLGDVTDAKLGFSITGDLWNKIIGMGPGVYFDAGKPKFLWLFNVSVPL